MEPTNSAAPEAPSQGTAAPQTLEESYDAAQTEISEGTGEKESQTTEAPVDAGTANESVEEPEHIKWVKSIDGDTNKETGEILVEKVAKRAFELNKQNQTVAQQLAQLQQILRNPEVAKAVLNVVAPGQQPAPAKPATEKAEKTDQEILDEYLEGKLNERITPLVQQNQMLYMEYAKGQMQNAIGQLRQTFGNDESGKPNFDAIGPEVFQQIGVAAQRAGVHPNQFIDALIRNGQLYPTLEATAKTILYPKMKEQVEALRNRTVQDKKKVNLTKPGTPAKSVNEVTKQVNSILEAARQAEAENPEFAKLS
jgi:hypothetical protein